MQTSHPQNHPLDQFRDQKTVVLTTFRRTGVGVPTAVHLVVDGDQGIVRTWDTSGKAKRIRHTPVVTIAPANSFGKPAGNAIPMHAEMINDEDPTRWSAMLARMHPIVQGLLVRRIHKLYGRRTTYIRLTPTDDPVPATAQARTEAGS
ncbi:MAG: PPOX class F420-dependent oxidoreductase [Thermomicrobiales bacterium]